MSGSFDWASIFSAINAAAIAFGIWSQKRSAKKIEEAKASADTIANNYRLGLRLRLSNVITTVETIRVEGNSALDIVLRTLAKTQRRLYEQTKDPSDLKLAEIAEARADVADALHAEIDQRLARAKDEQASIEAQIKKLNGSILKDV